MENCISSSNVKRIYHALSLPYYLFLFHEVVFCDFKTDFEQNFFVTFKFMRI